MKRSPPRQTQSEWLGRALPFGILLCTLIGSALLQLNIERQREARMETSLGLHELVLGDRLGSYETLLFATQTHLGQLPEPTNEELDRFVDSLWLKHMPSVAQVGMFWPNLPAEIGWNWSPQRRGELQRQALERRGGVRAGAPFFAPDASGKEVQWFTVTLPCEDGSGCVLYLLIDVDRFLETVVTIIGEGRDDLQLRQGGVLLGASTSATEGDMRSRRLSNMGTEWEIRLDKRNFHAYADQSAALLPPVAFGLGLLLALLTYFFIGRQLQMNRALRERNRQWYISQGVLQKSEAELRSIFQSMNDGAIFCSPGGTVQNINASMVALLGEGSVFLGGSDSLLWQSLLNTSVERPHGVYAALGSAGRRMLDIRQETVSDREGNLLGSLYIVRDVTEEHQSAERLREQERHWRAVLDKVPHILWLVEDDDFSYGNEEFRSKIGENETQLTIHPEDQSTYEAALARMRARGEVQDIEVRMGLSNDEKEDWRIVWLKLAPLGHRRWLSVATDVSKRRRAEARSRADREMHSRVLNSMPQLVWTADNDGHILFVNDRWAQQWPDAPLPTHVSELVSVLHPDDQERALGSLRGQRKRGSLMMIVRMRRGASYRTHILRAAALSGNEWLGTATDIQEQVYAEQSAQLLLRLSDALARVPLQGESVHGHALQTVAEELNATVALWRTSEHGLQLVGKHPPEASLPAALTANLPERPALRALEGKEWMLHPLQHSDGSAAGLLAVDFGHTPRRNERSNSTGLAQRFAVALENEALQHKIASAQIELAELNRGLEERVDRRTEALAAANRELEAFSYSVSHDLRTPLRHISVYSKFLQQELEKNGPLSERVEKHLGVVISSGQQMIELIDDLLEFSRTSRAELRQSKVELAELLPQVWKGLAIAPELQERAVKVHFGELPAVYGDARLLTQVFVNLFSNALKYSRVREEINVRVEATLEEGFVRVAVIDNGVGFDSRYQDRLFGVFQRLHTDKEFEGTGIGLANVKRIVQRHGGRVEASSVLGEGATFAVTLPLGPFEIDTEENL